MTEVWFLLIFASFGMTQAGPVATQAECDVAGRAAREAIGAKSWAQTLCIKGISK